MHKAKEHKSAHVQIVFALSLCGLFINKTFWVIALVIALANWKHIGQSISDVIRRGIQPKLQKSDSDQTIAEDHKTDSEQAKETKSEQTATGKEAA